MNVLLFKLFADAYSSEHIALLRPAQRSLARSWRAPSCLPRKSHIVRTIFNQRIISSHIHSNSSKFPNQQFPSNNLSFFQILKSTMTTPPVEHMPVIISEPNIMTEQKFQHAANSPSRMPRISPTATPSPTAVANQSSSATPSAVSEGQDGMIAKLLEHFQQQQQHQQVQQQGETFVLQF